MNARKKKQDPPTIKMLAADDICSTGAHCAGRVSGGGEVWVGGYETPSAVRFRCAGHELQKSKRA